MKKFFNFIDLLPNQIIERRCNQFTFNGTKDSKWAFNCIIKFLQYQKERLEKREITGGTLRNFVKSIKLFWEMSDIPVTWKKITRGLPKIRRHADDRAPKIEEIRKIIEYPDRRINAKFSNVESSFVVTIEKELNKRYRTLLYTLENIVPTER